MQLEEKGANVIIVDWNETEANRAANEINGLLSTSGRAYAVKTDVSSEQQVKHLEQQTLPSYGSVDINLKSVYLMIKYCIPEIRKNRGNIVNMASLNGLVGQRKNPIY
ncbi:SDR family NAD(P)-dependent oxidoreductase [Paenibacillus macquariensis]|uniref:Short chain dehydrogenase n=1 Tax=Paenibacillus macquariensis TaxID=948756 RepID=A0ABY1KDD5_9BACL|nr:SDR family NAD(P)-dependent oxidoreductase [Paenibacillus macquariensis]MEC0091921.1 SDR family NAD(P)-dependent oxidoreductase [Paenibacillus macquariensis]OAB24981.1 hypothetical protein PMSM_28515 [Paenibacillus macquariensis subsp. macquariensis]SIR65207.1 short chain dehydrogenase [Paenibacillus macquariensis]